MPRYFNFPSPHVHETSFDSASTHGAFAKRELDLGTGTMTVTDHGIMAGCRDVYDVAKKASLSPILGIEAYHHDTDCPILKASGIEDIKKYYKYGHVTIHYLDQKAYEVGCRILSAAHDPSRMEKHGSELKPIFTWRDLEELGQYNVTMTSGCLGGMVQAHVIQDRFDIAKQYYEKLRGIVKPGNFYVEVFPHQCDKHWVQGVYITLADQPEAEFRDTKKLKILREGAEEILEARELADLMAKKHPAITLLAQMDNRKWVPREPIGVDKAELREGFISNECREWCPDGDVQKGANEFVVGLAGMYGDPVIISDDAHYAEIHEHAVHTVRLRSNGRWRFYGHYHRMSSDEAWEYFGPAGIKSSTFEGWIDNNRAWADRFKSFKFESRNSLPTSFYPADTIQHCMALIKKHGRMDWGDTKKIERLSSELALIEKAPPYDMLSYFFLAEETCEQYIRRGQLPGPGRGSAAGLLISNLLGITHVDPLRYGLSQDRFMTPLRKASGKPPDIDMDFPTREPLVNPQYGWLKERFGDRYAQISTSTTLKLKSAIADTHRVLDGKVSGEIHKITGKLPVPPQGITDYDFVFGYLDADKNPVKGIVETNPVLREYVQRYPEHWDVVQQSLGLQRSLGRHASAFIIANEPIQNFIPTTTVGDVRVTQYTAKSVEAMGGLKMDFLVVSCLNDIGSAIRLIQKRVRPDIDWDAAYPVEGKALAIEDVPAMMLDGQRVPHVMVVPFGDKFYGIWNLPEDQGVFRDICSGKTETVFQFNTPGATQWLQCFWDGKTHYLDSIDDLAVFNALNRPGPLDYVNSGGRNMLQEYAARAMGLGAIDESPVVKNMLPETHGVMCYQEQLQRVFQEIGKTTGAEANQFREDISKKRMAEVMKWKETFMKGAVQTLSEKDAAELFSSMETFGQYGFNCSHAVCYSVIGYACAWLKANYPLEWWTSVLNNADRNEVNGKLWSHCGDKLLMPDLQSGASDFSIVGDKIRAPLSLINGIGPAAHAELSAGAPYRDLDDFIDRILTTKQKKGRSALNIGVVKKLILSGAADSLFPVEMATHERIESFAFRLAEKSGAKMTPRQIEEIQLECKAYMDLKGLQRYQLKKSVLSSWTEDLIPYAKNLTNSHIIHRNDELLLKSRHDDDIEVVRGARLRYCQDSQMIFTKAAIAYVIDAEIFSYDAGRKQACKLFLDVDGERFEYVKWPNQEGKLPPGIDTDLAGCVVAVSINRYAPEKDPGIRDIYVVQKPLELKIEEPQPHERTRPVAQRNRRSRQDGQSKPVRARSKNS